MGARQSTIRSILRADGKRAGGASVGSTGTHKIKPTIAEGRALRTRGIEASNIRLMSNGSASGGTSGGSTGTNQNSK